MKKITKYIEEDIEIKKKLAEIEKVVKSNADESVKIDSIRAILDELKAHILKTKLEAVTDDVTGFLTQEFFLKILKERVAEAKKQEVPLSLIFFDVDFLKKINDRFGHVVGTKTIKAIAREIKRGVRREDIVSRYGGDEFMVLCVSADRKTAQQVAERVQKLVLEIRFASNEIKKSPQISVSFGVASLEGKINTAPKILKEADKALHRAKKKRKKGS